MTQGLFVFVILFSSLSVYALEGSDILEKKLLEKNQEFISLQKQVESKMALSEASRSAFYPTLNAVGGWGQNRTDDVTTTEKGYLGYVEGRLNLFRGFKDQTNSNQASIEVDLIKFELESKKRELRLQLTEAVSNMILLHKFENILEEELKVTQTQRQMAARKVAAGLTGSVDNLEFDLRESEIQIEQKQIYQQHQETHQIFNKLFGEDITDADLEKLDFSNADKLSNLATQIKIENTLDYQKAEIQQRKSELDRTAAKADFLPSVDFTYSAGRITPSDESPMKFNESRYALLVTIPLFTGFESYYKIKSANFVSNSTEKLTLQKRSDVSADFTIAKTKAKELTELFQINENKLVLSQKYFNLTLSEYKRGIKNSPDLVTATERLFSSKKKKFELLKELELLKVKIENLI